MKRLTIHLVLALALGVGLVAALLWLAGRRGSAVAVAAEPCSPAAGEVITVCLDGGCDYSSIQAAVDAAQPGAVIKVAAGVYTDVSVRPVPPNYWSPPGSGLITQVVYITKSVVVQGGYTTTNWTTPFPITQPTILDAQGQGRVIFITGDVSPTIGGLRMTGGDAAGLGGWSGDVGGGIYVFSATAVISGNEIFSNTASSGAGVFIQRSTVVLEGNAICSNTASTLGGGVGVIWDSVVLLSGNSVTGNAANQGGGVYVANASAVAEVILTGNTIAGNYGNSGAGVFAGVSRVTFRDNRIVSNMVIPGSTSWSSGVHLQQATGPIVFTNDTIAFNR